MTHPSTTVANRGNGLIYVQLGAFSSQSNADNLRQTLSSTYPNIRIQRVQGSPSFYRVRIGPYQNATTSEQVLLSLKKQGYHNAIVVIE
jgi:rare lipoprotein A